MVCSVLTWDTNYRPGCRPTEDAADACISAIRNDDISIPDNEIPACSIATLCGAAGGRLTAPPDDAGAGDASEAP